jgi:predicted neutral ceramidase superfamily lipid hydrolase
MKKATKAQQWAVEPLTTTMTMMIIIIIIIIIIIAIIYHCRIMVNTSVARVLGYRSHAVVEPLYKPEGRGFENR